MTDVKQIYDFINDIAPFSAAEDWDNCGVIIGGSNKKVKKIVLSLDADKNAAQMAVDNQADLIVTHHPIIFDTIKKINRESIVYKLIRNDVSVLCAHTNLDFAFGGVTETLMNVLNLSNIKPLVKLQNGFGFGGIGELRESVSPERFAVIIKKKLGAGGIKFVKGNRDIKRVAVANGSESGLLQAAFEASADALVAGETKHNVLIDAVNCGMTLIDAGHYDTENIIIPVLAQKLENNFADIEILINTLKPYDTI